MILLMLPPRLPRLSPFHIAVSPPYATTLCDICRFIHYAFSPRQYVTLMMAAVIDIFATCRRFSPAQRHQMLIFRFSSFFYGFSYAFDISSRFIFAVAYAAIAALSHADASHATLY